MGEVVLCSGNVPLTFSFPGSTPAPERYSSTASTAVCYEQTFPAGYTDPKPDTEDWFNFITGFNAGNYSAFGMSAYVTSVMDRNLVPPSGLPSKMQFRTVISTADGSGSGESAYVPVDGIGTSDWTIYSSDSATVTQGLVEVEHFEFSASHISSTDLFMYGADDTSVGSTSNPPGGQRIYWTGVPGDGGYSGYIATATIAVPRINGGAAYAYGMLTNDGRALLNTSWFETEDMPTRTVLASASASGLLSSICGDYTGHVSASVGGYNDTFLMNPSGIVPGWDSTHTGENEYYWRMRSAWSAGHMTSTPVGCGLSGILELYPKGDPGNTHPILSSATRG